MTKIAEKYNLSDEARARDSDVLLAKAATKTFYQISYILRCSCQDKLCRIPQNRHIVARRIEDIVRDLKLHLQHRPVDFDLCSLALGETYFISLFLPNILILLIIRCSVRVDSLL